MTELEELRAQLAELTRIRNETVAMAKGMIANANKEFDREAIPLARRIRRLEPKPEPEPAPAPVARSPRRRGVSLAGTDDWTEEERRHFLELSRR